jgi:hypothetical protein
MSSGPLAAFAVDDIVPEIRAVKHTRRRAELAAIVALVASACVEPPGPVRRAAGDCGGVITDVPIESSPHVDEGPFDWSTNPPATGAHFPVWAQWERRYAELDRGYWLHNAEHGGVVLLHRCADCAADVAALVDVIRRAPADPHCTPPIRTRTLIAADPLLPDGADFAAVAWGVTYTAACVDQTVDDFVREHAGRAGENTCADGLPFTGEPLE